MDVDVLIEKVRDANPKGWIAVKLVEPDTIVIPVVVLLIVAFPAGLATRPVL